MRVKGKRKPVGHLRAAATPNPPRRPQAERAALYAQGLAALPRPGLRGAPRQYSPPSKSASDDGPARAFRERCRHYQEDAAAADWDGVEVRKTK